MAKNLDNVRSKLYEAFDKALELSESNMENGNNFEKVGARSLALQAAAQTAGAIATVEHEMAVLALIDEAKKRGEEFSVDFEKGTLRNIKPLSPIKLKAQGEQP